MKGPKVVLIGAGSMFFGRQTIWSMVSKEALSTGTLALVDTDARKLKWMEKIARRAIKAKNVPLQLEVSTDRKEVLKRADFVILAFAVEGVKLRGVDAEISTKHGMIMCSADTVGPGGIMRTIREVPHQNEILRDVTNMCPNAWVINWVNPTAAMGIAMMRNFPKLRSIALCDGPHNPHFDDLLMVQAGIAKSADKITDAMRSRTSILSGGVNHFNWLVEMTYKGKDVTGKIKEVLKNDSQSMHIASSAKGKVQLTNKIACQIADNIGYVPKCVWHTQEYLPYFQGHDVNRKDKLTIKKWLIQKRIDWMKEAWTDMRDIASGKRPIDDYLAKTTPDHASDIVEAMWTGKRQKFYINIANNGAVTNMQDDAFLEIPCLADMNRISPLPFGPMPRPLHGFMQRVLDEHELAVEAAGTFDRNTLRQAFLASMVSTSIPDVNACMDEMLRKEKKYLPAGWYK